MYSSEKRGVEKTLTDPAIEVTIVTKTIARGMLEKYKNKHFAKWARNESISDKDLSRILEEMSRGLLGDRLGAHLYKKRMGLAGRGKRGGARTIVLFKQDEIALFLYGYSKNEKDTLTTGEEEQLRIVAKEFMRLSAAQREKLKEEGKLIEIKE